MRTTLPLIAFVGCLFFLSTTTCHANKYDWWNKLSGKDDVSAASVGQARVWKPLLAAPEPSRPLPVTVALAEDATNANKATIANKEDLNSPARQSFRSYDLPAQFENESKVSETKIVPLKRHSAVSKVEALLDSYAARLSGSRPNGVQTTFAYDPLPQSSSSSKSNKAQVSWDDNLEFPTKQKLVSEAPLSTSSGGVWFETTTPSAAINSAFRAASNYKISRVSAAEAGVPRITSRFGAIKDKGDLKSNSDDSYDSAPPRPARVRSWDDRAGETTTYSSFERDDIRTDSRDSYDQDDELPSGQLQRGKTGSNKATAAPRQQSGRQRFSDKLVINHDVPARQTERESGEVVIRPAAKTTAKQQQAQSDVDKWANARTRSYFNWEKSGENDKLKTNSKGDSDRGSNNGELRSLSFEEDDETDGDSGVLRSKSYDNSEDDNAKVRLTTTTARPFDSIGSRQRANRKNNDYDLPQQQQQKVTSPKPRVQPLRNGNKGYGQRQVKQQPQQQSQKGQIQYNDGQAKKQQQQQQVQQRSSAYDYTTTAASLPRFDNERLRNRYEDETAEIKEKSYSSEGVSQLRSDGNDGAYNSNYNNDNQEVSGGGSGAGGSGVERESIEDGADPWEQDNGPQRQRDGQDSAKGSLINRDSYDTASKQAAKQVKKQKKPKSAGYSWSANIDHSNQRTSVTTERYEDDSRAAKVTTTSSTKYDSDDDGDTGSNSRLQKKSGWTQQTTERPQKLTSGNNGYTTSGRSVEYSSEVSYDDNWSDNAPLKRQGDSYSSNSRDTELLGNVQQNYEKTAPQRERQEDGGGVETIEGVDGENHSCRLQDSIPGEPDGDYPTLGAILETQFKCSDNDLPGYYGDMEARCQVFHVCQADGRKDSFLCPVGTIFNQQLFVCDWWMNFNCADTPSFYELNAELYVTPNNVQPQNNQLRRRSGTKIDYVSDNDEDQSAEINAEVEDDSRSFNEPQVKEKLQQVKEKVYFESQVSTKSPQRTSAQSAKSTRPARIQQQTTTYGARVRNAKQTAQLREGDNWASASEESQSTSSQEGKVTQSLTVSTPATPPASTLVPGKNSTASLL